MTDESIIYEGTERRSQVRITHCDCHPKHTQVLKDLKTDVHDIRKDLKERRAVIDDRMDKQHDSLWTAIRNKVSIRVTLAFIVSFTLAYVFGVIAVYKTTQTNRLLMLEVKTELLLQMKDLGHDIKDLKRHLPDRISDPRIPWPDS